MTKINCLTDYLRSVWHTLSYSYDDSYSYYGDDQPKWIPDLKWAKEPVDVMSSSEQLEQELSDAVAVSETGNEISQLYSYLQSIIRERYHYFAHDEKAYNYNEHDLRKGYRNQWDKYEELIKDQETVMDNLEAKVEELEARRPDYDENLSSLELRIQNRKQCIRHEQGKLDELYTRQNEINEYMQILDSCYKPALDEVAKQCRELQPMVEKYYNEWKLAHPKNEEPEPKSNFFPTYEEWLEKQKAKSDAETAAKDVDSNTHKDFFSPSLIIQIYELCNGNQFEECNSTTFIDAINLRITGTTLRIKNKEKVRVCYLVNRLWLLLPKNEREEWLSQILAFLGIDRKFYNSKYSISPREYDRSKATNTFYVELNGIINANPLVRK